MKADCTRKKKSEIDSEVLQLDNSFNDGKHVYLNSLLPLTVFGNREDKLGRFTEKYFVTMLLLVIILKTTDTMTRQKRNRKGKHFFYQIFRNVGCLINPNGHKLFRTTIIITISLCLDINTK